VEIYIDPLKEQSFETFWRFFFLRIEEDSVGNSTSKEPFFMKKVFCLEKISFIDSLFKNEQSQ